MPHNHKKALCTFAASTPDLASEAIKHALAAQPEWEAMPFNDRAAIFLRVRLPPPARLPERNSLTHAFDVSVGRRLDQHEVPRKALRRDHARPGQERLAGRD